MEDRNNIIEIGASAATRSTTPNVVSAWANIPSSEDHISVDGSSCDGQRSYEVPIHDPENNTNHTAKQQSSQPNTSRIRYRAGSVESRKPKKSGSSSRGSRPSSTYDDHDSTMAGGSENVWETTLNTPRTELSIQERIANTAISGTIELLKQVGGVTVSATGALVAPPLHITRTVLLPSLFAALKDFIASNSPVRVKDWFRIFSTSIYHMFNTLQNTEAGLDFSNRMVMIMIDLIDCISAETTRQLLLDVMSSFVKFFEVVQTPTFQAYCKQLTITGCRLIDALSNGRNKLLLHDIQKAVTSAGELLADPATTVALAEVTAYLCYALEMEDQQIQIDEHRHNSTTRGSTSNRTGGRRRHVRDTYQGETVLNRDTLDNGHSVEEAILSSLGVHSNHIETNQRDISIPASIVLDTEMQAQSMSNDVSVGPIRNKNQDMSKTLEWHELARNDVDVHLLREGILHRAQELKESTKANTKASLPVNQSSAVANNTGRRDEGTSLDNVILDKPLLDVEEQNAQEKVIVMTHDVDTSLLARRNKQSIAFQSQDDSNEEKDNELNKMPAFIDQLGLPHVQREWNTRKEGETADEHFYRILDEILGNARKETADKIIAEQLAHPSGMKAGTSRRLQHKKPQNSTIKDRLNDIRLELNANRNNSTTTKKKNVSAKLDSNGTKFFIVATVVALLIMLLWFLFGCYGLYVYFNPSAGLTSRSSLSSISENSGGTTTPDEIVIRVVKEIVHVDRDGKELGREPWKQQEGGYLKLQERIEYGQVAECIASAYK